MTRRLFFLRGFFWLTLLKIGFLLFVGAMVLVQIPEVRYDLGPKEPVVLKGLDGLDGARITKSTFVVVEGKPDFTNAFIYKRYGLLYSYFTIQPYGMRLVVRTYDKITDEWQALNRFVGKLRPFRHQPFHYRIRDIYDEKFQVEVPEEAYFLALDDVPRISVWQIGALCFASILWLCMFYFFFLFKRLGRGRKVADFHE